MAIPPVALTGELTVPKHAQGIVVFVHGRGSSRLSPRNQRVAIDLNARGVATLLFDLLTEQEAQDRRNVFDIPLLAERVVEAMVWISSETYIADLPVGLFGASTGAAAALVAAAKLRGRVATVVSRGGRPDLAENFLHQVQSPSLLIVGSLDHDVIALIGFGTAAGTVAAASDWDGPMEMKTARPPLADSIETLCHAIDMDRFLFDFRNPGNDAMRRVLSAPRLERYIGVIYRPDTERSRHYSLASLSAQYDAFVWCDTTKAVTPTPVLAGNGEEETFPFGL
ncbi:erythromycin esterase family protein [Yoonia sp.]|uniref:erythromycin esterase family protein n=1 Tax=Yoonia sp. TaxID=2212373 RepID=UPI0025FB346C|nr:erythromycin esterase family protein [Yoonia sp.]